MFLEIFRRWSFFLSIFYSFWNSKIFLNIFINGEFLPRLLLNSQTFFRYFLLFSQQFSNSATLLAFRNIPRHFSTENFSSSSFKLWKLFSDIKKFFLAFSPHFSFFFFSRSGYFIISFLLLRLFFLTFWNFFQNLRFFLNILWHLGYLFWHLQIPRIEDFFFAQSNLPKQFFWHLDIFPGFLPHSRYFPGIF